MGTRIAAPEANALVRAHLASRGRVGPSLDLDDFPWEHESATFVAFGRHFRVRTSDEDLGFFIDDAFAGMLATRPSADQPVVRYSIVAPTHLHGIIFRDQTQVHWNRDASALFERFVRDVNQHAIQSQPTWVKFHAGVVDHEGVGLVIAAPMESGKSTLTAGLLLRGYRYLSDEMAAIRVDNGRVDAYRKPLGLDPGSWPLFPAFEPDRSSTERYQQHQWQVPPRRFPHGSVDWTWPRVIIFPAYTSDGGTELTSVSPAEAVSALASCAFGGAQATADSLRRIAQLTTAAACYRLQHDDLAIACEAIDEAVEKAMRS